MINREAKRRRMIRRDARWTFVFTDWKFDDFDVSPLEIQVTFITMASQDCCIVMNMQGGSGITTMLC